MRGRDQFRLWLRRSNLSQRDGAVLLGVHYTYVNQLLSGRRRPGRETAVKIARRTGVPVEAWSPTQVGEFAPRLRKAAANLSVDRA